MIAYTLGVEDLADTRFAVSPLTEAVLSLRALREPGLFPLHRPWRRRALLEIRERNIEQLVALVGPRLTLPDFLTPRPSTTAPTFVDELGAARRASPATVRRDLRATRPSDGLPSALRAVGSTDAEVCSLRDELCDQMSSYWNAVIEPYWSEMHQLLDADMTYRARRLAVGGARTLFADIHPNLRWHDGVLQISQMISEFRVAAAGRGLLLVPSIFAHKPTPPANASEPPMVVYPSRGIATLWATTPVNTPQALTELLGSTRATLLSLLDDPLSTTELARRLHVTPSAVSQHLRVLRANGLLIRARAGRQVLYRRSRLATELVGPG